MKLLGFELEIFSFVDSNAILLALPRYHCNDFISKLNNLQFLNWTDYEIWKNYAQAPFAWYLPVA
uniref:Uncharacterized protein n=1 Tax=Megaselia scalaris TaxID=36166 RepID=T1GPA4_MEGSC